MKCSAPQCCCRRYVRLCSVGFVSLCVIINVNVFLCLPGFNWLLDITYPFTAQTVVTTDCKSFQIFAYQLNTLDMWRHEESAGLRNIVWMTERMPLYDTIEDGHVKGFNDDTLQCILRCFLLQPVDRGVDLRPYLPKDPSPVNKKLYINHVGDEPLEHPKIGRWQYPRNAVYF